MIEFYKDTNGTQLQDNDLVTRHNGFTGGADYVNFYIKNTNPNKAFTDLTISLVVSEAAYNYKLHYGSESLSLEEWNEKEAAIQINDIGTNTYHHIQCRITCKSNTASNLFHNGELKINVAASESVI